MRIENVMTKNPVACEEGDTVEYCAQLMREKNVGSVVALRNGKVTGIVTDRQLTVEVLANGGTAEGTSVKDVMTQNPATLALDDTIFSACDTFRSAGVVRRVPVVNAENELIGIVSVSDIAVVAQDLVEAIFLEETHHSQDEPYIQTGGKRIAAKIRRPDKTGRLPPDAETRPIRERTPLGKPGKAGRADLPAGNGESRSKAASSENKGRKRENERETERAA